MKLLGNTQGKIDLYSWDYALLKWKSNSQGKSVGQLVIGEIATTARIKIVIHQESGILTIQFDRYFNIFVKKKSQ